MVPFDCQKGQSLNINENYSNAAKFNLRIISLKCISFVAALTICIRSLDGKNIHKKETLQNNIGKTRIVWKVYV